MDVLSPYCTRTHMASTISTIPVNLGPIDLAHAYYVPIQISCWSQQAMSPLFQPKIRSTNKAYFCNELCYVTYEHLYCNLSCLLRVKEKVNSKTKCKDYSQSSSNQWLCRASLQQQTLSSRRQLYQRANRISLSWPPLPLAQIAGRRQTGYVRVAWWVSVEIREKRKCSLKARRK